MDARQARRPGHEPAQWRSGAEHAVGQLRALPNPDHGLLPQRLATLAAVLEDLPRERDVDGADLLACVALRAEGVGQVGASSPWWKGVSTSPIGPL